MSIPSRTQGATGNVHFKRLVSAQLSRLENQIPAAYRLPKSILEDPPLNVTTIPESCGILTADELAITGLDATDVLAKIASGSLTAVAVVTAFGKRAAIAHQLTACLTDFFLDEGIQRAKELDAYFETHQTTVGPLHGLPISIKDQIPVKGRWGTGGFLSTLELSPEDGSIARILRGLGAGSFICEDKSTPIDFTSGDYVLLCAYGMMLNPYRLDLSPGGSSGGESALLAMKGSCMGIGTDAGGSIRAPCAFTGLYGIRPTCNTFPMSPMIWYQLGNDSISGSAGPMCRSARDLKMLIQAVHSTRPWQEDPSLLPIPLEVPDISQRKLRVGIMMHDGVVLPHPPILRALKVAREKLEASGEVEIVEYAPYKHQEGFNTVTSLYIGDGGETICQRLRDGGEDILPLTEWVASPPLTKNRSATQAWELHHQRDCFRHAYLHHWRAHNIDVLLSPAYPAVAPLHDTARYWGCTAIWNLVDYPGAVFPTGLVVDPNTDVLDPNVKPLGPSDVYYQQLYTPEAYADVPIGLHVTAPRFNDGLVLAALDVIEHIVRT